LTQILEVPAQRKFVSAGCHAHSNAHKPPKSVAPTTLQRKFVSAECHAHSNVTNRPKLWPVAKTKLTLKPVSTHILFLIFVKIEMRCRFGY